MAVLPSSGAITMTQVNSLLSRTGATSIDLRTLDYMGDSGRTGTAHANLGICMPNMIINKNTGGLAKNATNWVFTGTLAAWRPYNMSQFYGAYSGRPAITVTKINLGTAGTGQLRADASGSDAYTGAGTPYSFFSTSTNAWSIAVANVGRQVTYTVSNGTYNIYVRDYLNCGANKEFAAVPTPTYP
jgi:hypothetical protein